MYELTEADRVWNRACMERGGTNPQPGDSALAALLQVHGLTMNGGVLHSVESLSLQELECAKSGYRFFGLDAVAELVARAQAAAKVGQDLESQEGLLNGEYAELIPDDSYLVSRFEEHFRTRPSDFAPLC